jgi:hypothetical protein
MHVTFKYWTALIGIAWTTALVVLAVKAWRAWPAISGMLRDRRAARTKARAELG